MLRSLACPFVAKRIDSSDVVMTHGLRAGSGEPLKANTRHTALVAALLGALLLAGCATGRSAQDTASGWFDRVTGKTSAAEAEPRASYAAVARLKLYREPDASSAVVGELALHEGVLRYQDDRGFAYVKARKSGLEGWVREGQLSERLPSTSKPAAKASSQSPAQTPGVSAAPSDSAPTEASPTPPTDAPNEAAPPDPNPDPQAPERSIFDPY
jgi:hypothetical protein